MKFILGTKKEMTQIFTENGELAPATVIKAGPCVITQVKSVEKDGYLSIQVGYGEKSKLNKPMAGHLKSAGKTARFLKEFRDEIKSLKVGDQYGAEIFKEGDIVDVRAISKGKGFQGVVKRHGFGGSPASHGHKDQLRMPGSIGSTGPAHVFKGVRMAGRMGGESVTIKNLEIIKIDEETNLIYVKGATPGAYNGLVEIKGDGEMKIREVKNKEEVKEDVEEGKNSKLEIGNSKLEKEEVKEGDKKEEEFKEKEKDIREEKVAGER